MEIWLVFREFTLAPASQMSILKMDTSKLIDTLSAICPISKNFRKNLEKELTPLSLPENYMLLEAPRISDHAYFLESGFAMSYRFIEGKKVVEGFWGPGQIIFSAKSFFTQVPSTEFIQLMKTSSVFCISYVSTRRLFSMFSEANTIQRLLLVKCYETERERFRDLFELSTMQRHEKLLSSYPGIEQIIAQENIASYLGITPQALSRAKRKHSNH